MSDSLITNTLNHLSDTAVTSVLMAGVGYLCARAVVYLNSNLQIDPRIGLVSGATSGLIIGLFFTEDSNTSSKIVAAVALIFVPFKICQRKEIPATFKAVLAITAATVVISSVAMMIFSVFD